jgi:hypothetical protein
VKRGQLKADQVCVRIKSESIMTDVARAIVEKIELSGSKSVDTLKGSVYRGLAALGVDVEKLRKDAVANEIARLAKTEKKKAKNSQQIAKLENKFAEVSISTKDDWGEHSATSYQDRLDWAVARLKDHMEPAHFSSAVELRRVYSIASNIDTEYLTRDQDAAVKKFNAIWSHMSPTTRFIAVNFIFDEAPHGHDRPLTMLEFGQRYGASQHLATSRGGATCVLKYACEIIHHTMTHYGAWQAYKTAAQPKKLSDSERRLIEGRR